MFNLNPRKLYWSFKDCTFVSVDQFEIYTFTSFLRSLIKLQMWTSQAMVRIWMHNNHDLCLSLELNQLKIKNKNKNFVKDLQFDFRNINFEVGYGTNLAESHLIVDLLCIFRLHT